MVNIENFDWNFQLRIGEPQASFSYVEVYDVARQLRQVLEMQLYCY